MSNLEQFREQFVLVVGDLMVDKYILGDVERISPEAPVPVLRQREIRRGLGGAGNVVANIVHLGGKVRMVGQLGDDAEGQFVRDYLRISGVDGAYVVPADSTIVKTRVSASNQQFIRIDEETVAPPSQTAVEMLTAEINHILQKITVVVISDYAKGFVTEEIAQLFIRAAKERSIPVLVDSKGTSAAKYAGATAITPNNKEFLGLAGLTGLSDEEDVKAAALDLCDINRFSYCVFTRSQKGISVIDSFQREKRDYPALVKEVVDVTGAGDTVVSVLALAMGAGFAISRCVTLANLAASMVVSKFGAAQVSLEEMGSALHPWDNKTFPDGHTAAAQLERMRKQGKRIVFTNGCFDLVHAGHISSFRQARNFGDILVVGLNSDESVRSIKGPTRPMIPLAQRAALLAALECVDFVIPFEESTPETLIRQIRPDVLVKGKDWEGKEVAGAEFIRSYGGSVKFIPLEQGLSTSVIIDKIKRTLI